jgi:hypothetical protein
MASFDTDATSDDHTELMAGTLRLKHQQISCHAPNLVGWWCSLLDYLFYLVLFCCQCITRWVGECTQLQQ